MRRRTPRSCTTQRIWKASAAEYQGLHDSKESAAKYYAAYARGAYMSILQFTWDRLTCPAALHEAGFIDKFTDKSQKAMALDKSSALWRQEMQKTDWMFDIAFETTKARGLTMQHYMKSFPYQLAGLLSAHDQQCKARKRKA